jgi:hypothetical protein
MAKDAAVTATKDELEVDRTIPFFGILPFVSIHIATVAFVAYLGWSCACSA